MNYHIFLIFVSIVILLNGCASTPETITTDSTASPSATVTPPPLSSPVRFSSIVPIGGGQEDKLRGIASRFATRYAIDEHLFHALIQQESNWNPYAMSNKGARGLTQIMPVTGRTECGLEAHVLFDPWLNLNCGAFYLSKQLRRFNNVELALAAYNSGPTRVARLGRVPPIRETERYVQRIISDWQWRRHR
jgi:soluble lytic murein transglycosylase-like protein